MVHEAKRVNNVYYAPVGTLCLPLVTITRASLDENGEVEYSKEI